MQSYIIIHKLATLFIKKYATLHNLSFFLLFNTRIPIFAEENQRTQNYGTRNLLGKKRRPDRRAEDRQTLGRRSQQRRQALPRPASERTRRGRETSIKQEGNLFGLPSLRRERLVNLPPKTLIFCLILLYYSVNVTLLSSKAHSEICNHLLFSNLYVNLYRWVLNRLFELISFSVS